MSQNLPVARFARMWSDSIAIGVAGTRRPATRPIPSDVVLRSRSRPQSVPDAPCRFPGCRIRSEVAGLRCERHRPEVRGRFPSAVRRGSARGRGRLRHWRSPLRDHAVAPTAKETTAACFWSARSDTATTVAAAIPGWGSMPPSARGRCSRTSGSARRWLARRARDAWKLTAPRERFGLFDPRPIDGGYSRF